MREEEWTRDRRTARVQIREEGDENPLFDPPETVLVSYLVLADLMSQAGYQFDNK